ncbi:MAG: aminotransferase class V-fold PLP-dependent enzyme [Nitrospiraceae bacterium]|nr:aminotransferase class V-fold PLP-dependent enzyme [Nitrospiraceae bacterium]
MQLIFETSRPGRRGVRLDPLDVPEATLPAEFCREDAPNLPEVGELDVVRHFTRLSARNFGVDSHFYPLGSCTMKYNPKLADAISALPGLAGLHPHLSSSPVYHGCIQGALEIVYETEHLLAEIAGMREVSLQPIAGAHGELTGALLIAAYHRAKGNKKDTIIIPDSAHGTNPASATIAGFKVVQAPSGADGTIRLDAFKNVMNDSVAGVMLTCPNTHGLFEPDVHKIADLAHEADALLYYDGANLNAIIGQSRPGDLGFDVMHFNLHKTFATPHGMGGPGSGPVGVGERLAPFLPGPRVTRTEVGFGLEMPPQSIGKIAAFFGNFLVAARAYAYLLCQGDEGLKNVARYAVLNANYILARLKDAYDPAYDTTCMHECVFTATRQAKAGVRAIDIAKALLDRGFHAPTIYFPLTVKESIMIEPTETESKQTLDAFCDAMRAIAQAAQDDPESLHAAPQTTPVGRLDEVRAARELDCGCL